MKTYTNNSIILFHALKQLRSLFFFQRKCKKHEKCKFPISHFVEKRLKKTWKKEFPVLRIRTPGHKRKRKNWSIDWLIHDEYISKKKYICFFSFSPCNWSVFYLGRKQASKQVCRVLYRLCEWWPSTSAAGSALRCSPRPRPPPRTTLTTWE